MAPDAAVALVARAVEALEACAYHGAVGLPLALAVAWQADGAAAWAACDDPCLLARLLGWVAPAATAATLLELAAAAAPPSAARDLARVVAACRAADPAACRAAAQACHEARWALGRRHDREDVALCAAAYVATFVAGRDAQFAYHAVARLTDVTVERAPLVAPAAACARLRARHPTPPSPAALTEVATRGPTA